MSLRDLHRYLQENTPTYMVRDGRHIFIHWRRANEVHAFAKQYLEAKIPGINNSGAKAAQACQDLIELKLLSCIENNEPRR